MANSEYTGERWIPELAPKNVSRDHLTRYDYAGKLIVGNRVLDVACGVGFGMKILTLPERKIVGIDSSWEAVKFGHDRYLSKHQSVVRADAHSFPFRSNTFSTVISFETIEHLRHPDYLLKEIRRTLIRGGRLIISTPVRKQRQFDQFHLHEFTIPEFVRLVSSYFTVEEVKGQRLMLAPWFWLFSLPWIDRLKRVSMVKNLYRRLYGRDAISPLSRFSFCIPNFIVVVARKE